MSRHFIFFLGGGFRPWQPGEARLPEGTRKISRNHGSELSDATIVPQGDVVADMTRRDDKLNPIPGNAVAMSRHVILQQTTKKARHYISVALDGDYAAFGCKHELCRLVLPRQPFWSIFGKPKGIQTHQRPFLPSFGGYWW